MMIKKYIVFSICAFGFASCALAANPLINAANIQKQAINQTQIELSKEQNQEQVKAKINAVLQILFQRYYIEVKKSPIKLSNAQQEVDRLNMQRRRTGKQFQRSSTPSETSQVIDSRRVLS